MADAVRLGVARLTECGEAAGYCRHQPERSVEGYCLVAGDEWGCRVTIYLQHGRTLTDRTAGGLFYYEGWLVTPEEPFSLGVFNTGATGEGSAACEPEAWALERAVGIRVTAEPHGGSDAGHRPVLEGQLIWLQGQGAPALSGPESEEEAALESPPEPALAPVSAAPPLEPLPEAHWHPATPAGTTGAAAPWSDMLSRAGAGAGGGGATATATAGPPPDATHAPEAAPVPAAAPVAEAEPRHESEPHAADAPAGTAPPDSAQPGGPLYPEPANLVATVVPVTRNVALSSIHPMAPRAVGAAVVRLRDGQVTLTLRGLPAPPALGRDPATNRPFNAYRVWLLNQRTGQGSPLGICERLWGESYRFQSEPGLVLNGHDTMLVTAGDRSEVTPDPATARVLSGRFN